VLRRRYRFAREQIAVAIESLLQAPLLAVEHAQMAELAVKDYRSGRADFTDSLIGRINRRAGCEATVTFERKTAQLDSFRLL
jgi:predicted nucleic-acid-binding protein